MKWVSYTRSISSRIGEENPSNTIAEQNERIARYLKKRGCSVSEKYSDRKRTAEATEGFDKLVQDGMARKFDAVAVDAITQTEYDSSYDKAAKKLLANKQILAQIMKNCVNEYSACSVDEIAEKYIEGTPEVGTVGVHVDDTNRPRVYLKTGFRCAKC